MVDVDLNKYPTDYRGRQSFVFVRAIEKVVARCYTYSMGGVTQLLPEYGGPAIDSKRIPGPMVMRDIGEYTSPVDGSHITSRGQHRDHVRRHDLVEVGNERIGSLEKSIDTGGSIGRDIKKALESAS